MADSFNPSPYAMFDPTQWLNQFSRYNNQPMPWPSSYAGAPTNALGQQITGAPDYLSALANPGPVTTHGAIAGQSGPIYQQAPAARPASVQSGYLPGPAAPAAPAPPPPAQGMTINTSPMGMMNMQQYQRALAAASPVGGPTDAAHRTMLAQLLANPPAAGQGASGRGFGGY